MKRIALMLLIAVAATVTALAANPRLACESLFSEKYRSNPQATVSIINSTGNYFRGISVANDPSLVGVSLADPQQNIRLNSGSLVKEVREGLRNP